MGLLKRNPLVTSFFIKMVNPTFRAVTHRRYRGFNELNIEGSEIIRIYRILMYYLYRIIRPTLLMLWRCSMCLTPAKGTREQYKNVLYLWNLS
jgi:hypothetical protein